ncbi:MAG: hypothetical protein HY961_16595 [Ignavibacteriae bacterium]|nr:hypothetical protein [Ignavibacteriota bacterium]
MKRRDFLLTPGLSILVPTLGMQLLPGYADASTPDGQAETDNAKFPQNLHQDFVTYHPGIEYFLLGNGDIQAVVQYSPRQDVEKPQTFLGLTLMSSEHFARKWSTFLFHPEAGLGRTMINIVLDGKQFSPNPESFRSIDWKYIDNVPVVSLHWNAGFVDVEEEFFLPAEGGILYRRLTATNNGSTPAALKVNAALVPNFVLFDDIYTEERTVNGDGFYRVRLLTDGKSVTTSFRYHMSIDKGTLPPRRPVQTLFTYAIGGDERKVPKSFSVVEKRTKEYWSEKTQLQTGNANLDHLFNTAKTGIKANIARSGKRDAGIWMYNMEWVRDDSMFVLGLVQAGFIEEAKIVLTKMLERSVGSDGRTIESSRWFGYDYTELDQNGQLLYAVWSYFCWTGDEKFVRKYWKKLKLVADFPLQDVFWNKIARMLRNKREYWERNDSFGFSDGFELAYQFWVVLGLEKIVEVAEQLGDKEPVQRWRDAARQIKSAMLDDPKFKLVEDGHLIKRRTLDGTWLQHAIPPNRKSLPPGSPIATEERPTCDPDTCEVQPIVYGMVDPSSALARKTLEWVDTLWNQRWTTGGYPRYNVSSEPDPPGAWPVASLFLARAYAEVRNSEKVWRVVDWLNTVHGGKSGGLFERYGPSITPPAPPVGIVGWAWAETICLVCENIMGVRPDLDKLVLRPNLLEGITEMNGKFKIRGVDVDVLLRRSAERPAASVNGKKADVQNGTLTLRYPSAGSLKIEMSV